MENSQPNREYPEELFPLQAVTGTIIAAGFAVFKAFGFGFLESVYRRAVVVELRHRGVVVDQEALFALTHLGEPVGVYKADVIAERRVIVEVKTGVKPDPDAPTQLLNYLSAANLDVGLVLDFGPKGVRVKRMIASAVRESVAE
jgi:GxxExxY protein